MVKTSKRIYVFTESLLTAARRTTTEYAETALRYGTIE